VSRTDEVVAVLADIIALVRRERIVLTAASIAYFAFISLVPLLLLVVVAVTALGGDALATRAITRATRTLVPENADLLREIVFGAADGGGATILSAAVLLWGALLTFRALDTAFGGIYGTHGERSVLGTVFDIVLVFVVVVVAVVAMVVGGVVLSVFVETQLWKTLGPVVVFGVFVVVFVPLYYILPDIDSGVLEVLPGTVFAAVAWTVLQSLYGYYASISTLPQLYGAASAVLLILVWLYVGGFVLLVGAALNATLADRADPDAEWVPIDL
jgi:membrane protein